MGLLDFVKEAGEWIFGGKEAEAITTEDSNQATVDAIIALVNRFNLNVDNLGVEFNDGVVVLTGSTPTQEEKEKIVLTVGNVQGVHQDDDRLEVENPAPEAVYYTVQKGDTLWKIASDHYGEGNKYMTIFEANKPMLSDPDKIYPDQVLRIPPQ